MMCLLCAIRSWQTDAEYNANALHSTVYGKTVVSVAEFEKNNTFDHSKYVSREINVNQTTVSANMLA